MEKGGGGGGHMQSTEGGFGLVIPDSDFLQFGASWLLVESKGRITKGSCRKPLPEQIIAAS